MNPVHEAKDVDVSEVSKRLSVWHTLPVEASALLTLYPPEELAKLGSLWFSDREVPVTSGYDDPVLPCRAGTLGLGWLIKSLILPAQVTWWDTMKTRPEAGRFGVKLEGSGKVRVFAIGNPIWQALLRPLHDWGGP
ncbi:hypothetical protein IEQ34_023370 [Dendrobium chrysotoxum]|uniref:Uncharacterized protein n=1 Tax=Dendrobium chrysotoxum TaxID=161865 RepID=A0AAV7FVN8_DENCH|nr:hypothetical protein IEQ34_026217 [Dendrobium chrysotoxum]KAH0439016.1 hypothetical protein IEQ34_025968 [Dendrobium chrysotoxum]KAH0439777.1 hypothetical protein IEQ34_025807 [Dendrobium chrysotoxum]KAH0440345.1 hypothetical protein IEQ34_025587 [Dendrobium chrysotoxum]KAH0440376.1 hypothetical protein IEQ34_025618 [Dendrobium chrysotoxum]